MVGGARLAPQTGTPATPPLSPQTSKICLASCEYNGQNVYLLMTCFTYNCEEIHQIFYCSILIFFSFITVLCNVLTTSTSRSDEDSL